MSGTVFVCRWMSRKALLCCVSSVGGAAGGRGSLKRGPTVGPRSIWPDPAGAKWFKARGKNQISFRLSETDS
jgi:hypothetical protein